MKPMSVPLFQQYWDELGQDPADMLDWDVSMYQEWEEDQIQYSGMHKMDSNVKNGVVRIEG